MTRGVRLYLVGSVVLVSLAGCGKGFFQAEREPWRAEAEVACLKSGAVKETPELVRIDPISGRELARQCPIPALPQSRQRHRR